MTANGRDKMADALVFQGWKAHGSGSNRDHPVVGETSIQLLPDTEPRPPSEIVQRSQKNGRGQSEHIDRVGKLIKACSVQTF